MGFLGISHSGMTMGPDGKMTMDGCPFMSGTGICNMSPLEHVAMWQSLFAGIPQRFDPTLILLTILASIVFVRVWMRSLYPPPRVGNKQSRYYVYRKNIPIINAMKELFSCGILNPKAF